MDPKTQNVSWLHESETPERSSEECSVGHEPNRTDKETMKFSRSVQHKEVTNHERGDSTESNSSLSCLSHSASGLSSSDSFSPESSVIASTAGPVMLNKISETVRRENKDIDVAFTDRLGLLTIKEPDLKNLEPTYRKSSLPNVTAPKKSLVHQKLFRSFSTELPTCFLRINISDNFTRNRMPRIEYNVSKDSCTVAAKKDRPIYPSLPYSPFSSPTSSPNLQRCEGQCEKRRISLGYPSGFTQLYQYRLTGEIGRGSFGVVKLAYNVEDCKYYAMKILSKKKLMRRAGLYGRMPPRRNGQKHRASPIEQISREIAILKKLDHVNIVKLCEVLNESEGDNLYMVFELVEHGPVIHLPTPHPLAEEEAWQHFRDVIMGIEYLHFQKIIHRDIKPSNLLLNSQNRIQISDFGVCNQFEGVDAFLSDTSGTPAFVAPEALKGNRTWYSGKALDIWQMGVSLYSFVYGHVPYDDSNILALYTKIRADPLHFPSGKDISGNLKDLLRKMLDKDPSSRIKLSDIKMHPWVTKNASCFLQPEVNCTYVEVTEEEISNCMRPIPKLDTLVLIKSMLKKHSFSHPFKESPEYSKLERLRCVFSYYEQERKIAQCLCTSNSKDLEQHQQKKSN